MTPTPQSKIDAILAFDGIGSLGGFQTVTGLEEVAEVIDDFAPGAQYADKSVGNSSIGNATVTRSWDEARDRPLYNQLKGKLGIEGDLGRIVRDRNRIAANMEPFTCILIRFKGPEGDTNGGTAKGTLEIEVAVTGRG